MKILYDRLYQMILRCHTCALGLHCRYKLLVATNIDLQMLGQYWMIRCQHECLLLYEQSAFSISLLFYGLKHHEIVSSLSLFSFLSHDPNIVVVPAASSSSPDNFMQFAGLVFFL